MGNLTRITEVPFSSIWCFCLGTVDISRLNYAILSPIPNVKGADSIRRLIPIVLINNLS